MNMAPRATSRVDAGSFQEVFSITGAQPLAEDVNTLGNYLEPIKQGVYSVAMCRTGAMGDFPFRPIYDNAWAKQPIHAETICLDSTYLPLQFIGTPPGWDPSYDTHILKISVPPGDSVPAQGLILKVWRRIEYTPVMYRLLWHIASQGVPRDDRFFKTYAAMERNLPIAVTAKENPDFWDTMLAGIKTVTNVTRMIPGPIGAVSDIAYNGARLARRLKKGSKVHQNPAKKYKKQKQLKKQSRSRK